jgi:RNA-directed DNA polymerase
METSGSDTVSPKLQRIAELARAAPEMVFTTLAHHIDVDFLREAYRSVRHDGATGVDNETAEDFGKDLEERLQTLLEKLKSGSYRAPPVRRVRIPKDGGKTRPIGIPTFEDKVLQKAVTMVLEAIYEQDFLDCSYGFRPGRSAHQALQTFWEKAMKMGGGWVIDLDIQAFFDNLDHGHLRSFLDQRVRDGVLRRAIGKWLKAGVMEHGSVSYPDAGSPQGGVISPLLANLYLHEVLDKWFERTVKPRLWGVAFLIRYADDAIIMCANAHDANRVMRVLPKRFGRFGLTLHPDKTRLVDFGWPLYPRGGSSAGGPRPGTFDFLGFTHFWGKSRKGRWIIKRKTAKTRFSRAVTRIAHWCRRARHQPIRAQQQTLNRKLQGHDAYYGITGNSQALARLRYAVRKVWRKWLDRRGGKKRMTWDRFRLLEQRYPLASAVCVHSSLRERAAKP